MVSDREKELEKVLNDGKKETKESKSKPGQKSKKRKKDLSQV